MPSKSMFDDTTIKYDVKRFEVPFEIEMKKNSLYYVEKEVANEFKSKNIEILVNIEVAFLNKFTFKITFDKIV